MREQKTEERGELSIIYHMRNALGRATLDVGE